MTDGKRRIFSLAINSLIVAIECYVLSNSYFGYCACKGQGNLMFRFFTEDSNLLLGLSCLFYALLTLIKKGTPSWVRWLRYVATGAISTTFFVVFFFLAPATGILYGSYWLMWSWPNATFTHFVCPVLSVVSFLLFEEKAEFSSVWKRACLTLLTVGPYAVVVGSLASLQLISSDPKINNVYGFMDATAGPWWAAPLAVVLIFGLNYLEGCLLLALQNKIALKRTAALTKAG